MVNENDTAWVRRMLYPGENLLWTGKPGKGHFFCKEDAYLILSGLLGFAFAVFWEVMVIRKEHIPFFFKLWGILLILSDLYFTAGRFIAKAIRRKNSRYALTSQRIILKVGKICKTLDLNDLPRMIVTQRADGSGDVRFGESADRRPGIWSGFGSAGSAYTNVEQALLNIPDVNRVEYRIRSAVEQALCAKQA